MNLVKFKYESVSEAIMKMIETGEFPSGKLPSEQSIMKRFKIGKITAYKALEKLAEQGVIVRIKGKGTYVNDRNKWSGADFVISRSVAVVMHTSGHYHGDFFTSVKDNLIEKGYFPIAFDVKNYHFDEFFYKSNLTSLLTSGIKGLLIYGNAYWRAPFMEKYPQIKSIFMDYYDYDGVPPYGGVMADYECGFYLATKHLLSCGRKNIVLFRHHWRLAGKVTDSHRKNNPIFQMEEGYRKALKECGCAEKENIFVKSNDKIGFDLQLKGLLSSTPEPIDAVICSSDSLALEVLFAAIKIGVKVPDDLAIVGLYNTPWSLESPVPMTSINMNTEQIAKKSIEMLLDPSSQKGNIVKIKPNLIIRESTGGDSSLERETERNCELEDQVITL